MPVQLKSLREWQHISFATSWSQNCILNSLRSLKYVLKQQLPYFHKFLYLLFVLLNTLTILSVQKHSWCSPWIFTSYYINGVHFRWYSSCQRYCFSRLQQETSSNDEVYYLILFGLCLVLYETRKGMWNSIVSEILNACIYVCHERLLL